MKLKWVLDWMVNGNIVRHLANKSIEMQLTQILIRPRSLAWNIRSSPSSILNRKYFNLRSLKQLIRHELFQYINNNTITVLPQLNQSIYTSNLWSKFSCVSPLWNWPPTRQLNEHSVKETITAEQSVEVPSMWTTSDEETPATSVNIGQCGRELK